MTKRIKFTCPVCFTVLELEPHKAKVRKYCSNSCQIKEQWADPIRRDKLMSVLHSPEIKERKSKAQTERMLNRWADPDIKAMYMATINSTDRKNRTSIRGKQLWADENSKFNSSEYRQLLSSITKERQSQPKVKEKLSIETKEKWKNTEYRDKMTHSMNEQSVKDKHALSIKKRWEDPAQIDAIRQRMLKQWKDPEYRLKQSMDFTQRIIKDEGYIKHSKFKRGFFFSIKNNKNIKYDSSYELRAYTKLEQMEEVLSYGRCNFYIDYTYKEILHKYIPDILIDLITGKKQIIEVKPLRLVNKYTNPEKFKAAKIYCDKQAMEFLVWTENDISEKNV